MAVGGSGRAVGAGCGGWDACWGASVAGGCDIVDDGESWRTPEKGGFTELCAFELEETSFINFLRSSRLSVTNEFPVLEGWGWSGTWTSLMPIDDGPGCGSFSDMMESLSLVVRASNTLYRRNAIASFLPVCSTPYKAALAHNSVLNICFHPASVRRASLRSFG